MKDLIIQDLIRITSKNLGVDIRDKNRSKIYVEGRFIVYYLLKKSLGYTYSEIGRAVQRTHATVLHGVRELPFIIKFNPEVGLLKEKIAKEWTSEASYVSRPISKQDRKNLEEKIFLLNLEIQTLTKQLESKQFYEQGT